MQIDTVYIYIYTIIYSYMWIKMVDFILQSLIIGRSHDPNRVPGSSEFGAIPSRSPRDPGAVQEGHP